MRIPLILLLSAALSVTASCGGGGGGGGGDGGGQSTGRFSVRAVDPRSGFSSLPNDASVTIFLNDEVEPESITDNSLYVERQDDGVRHAGVYSVSSDRRRVTFTPSPWFDVATGYRIVATTDLMSGDGDLLIREFRSSFSTGPWPSPKTVHQKQFTVLLDKLAVGRSSHTQTSLPLGFVLIAGGYRSGTAVTASAEIYDSGRDDFFMSMGSLSEAKANHTATMMTNGLVLLAGGERAGDFRGLASADLFSTGSMDFIPTTPMLEERTFHTATALIDGRVLVTGGRTKDDEGNTVWHRSAEIYDPEDESWTATGNEMSMLRAGHRATRLLDGRVLITGGSGNRVAEIYDPATDRFKTITASMFAIRSLHGSVLLPNGVVFLSDGGNRTGELYNPDQDVFTPTANQSSIVRNAALHFEFRPGEVLNLGGIDFDASFLHATMEQYVQDYGPTGRYFGIAATPENGVYLADPRAYAAVSQLTDGRFLITGGLGPDYYGSDLETALIFDPKIEKDDP